mgnify:CR=1 FL=1
MQNWKTALHMFLYNYYSLKKTKQKKNRKDKKMSTSAPQNTKALSKSKTQNSSWLAKSFSSEMFAWYLVAFQSH